MHKAVTLNHFTMEGVFSSNTIVITMNNSPSSGPGRNLLLFFLKIGSRGLKLVPLKMMGKTLIPSVSFSSHDVSIKLSYMHIDLVEYIVLDVVHNTSA